MTIWRVVGGFVLAALVAVPLGILMGAYKPIEAFLEPFVSFARYLPASAFIPLLILWAGIGETAEAAGHLHRLGVPDHPDGRGRGRQRRGAISSRPPNARRARPRRASRRVLIPSTAPDIAEILRLVLGWAWTYVIVAELIGSSSGIGHMIIDSQALLATGQIIFGIIVIGIIGLDLGLPVQGRSTGACSRGGSRERQAPSIEDVSRVFPGVRGGAPTRALEPTTLAVADNDFITILGPSGCGKSTLLRIVAGLDTADERPGPARRRAGDGAGRRSRHGVPVLHAVSLAHGRREHRLRPAREGRAGGRARAHRRATGSTRVGPAAASRTIIPSSSPAACSSAPRSRARSPTIPTILLLDEPFGALDNQTRALMQELLLGIWERERKTVLFVTHDIEEAIFLASRVLVMTRAARAASRPTSPSTCPIRATTASRPARTSPTSRRGSRKRSASRPCWRTRCIDGSRPGRRLRDESRPRASCG